MFMSAKLSEFGGVIYLLSGTRSGDYSQETSDELWSQDIVAAKTGIVLAISNPDFMNSRVLEQLETKLDSNEDFRLKMLVGPDFDLNHSLYSHPSVDLVTLSKTPVVNCRVVDSKGTYIDNGKRFSQTSQNVKALSDRSNYLQSLANYRV